MPPPEFFTATDFEDLAKYEGEYKDNSNEDHNLVYERLSKTYLKIEYWAEQVQKIAFPEGWYQLRKRPTNQANNFQAYQWAKIYPEKNSPEHLAFTVGISTDDLFEIKIDTVGLDEKDVARTIYLHRRGDYYKSQIVKLVPASAMLSQNWNALIRVTVEYVKSLYPQYQELIAAFDSAEKTIEKNSAPSRETGAYWLLKLNYERWSGQAFYVGVDAYYHTHNPGEEPRPDYDLFSDVKPGDLVIGYDFFSSKTAVCVFVVTKEKHIDKSRGEVIDLKMEKIIPRVPLTSFENQIDFLDDIEGDSPRRLFSITPEIFNAILGSSLSEQEKIRMTSRFLSRSPFTISDTVEPVLGVKSVAAQMAELIWNLKTDDVGKMIGVFGNWGRGKTFMVEQIWKALKGSADNPGPFIRVNFHAWKYQDTSASWAYLYEAFAKKYFEKEGSWLVRGFTDAGKRLDLNVSKHGAWPIIRFLLTVAFFGISLYYSLQFKQAVWFILTAVGAVDGIRLGAKYFERYKLKEKASEVFLKYFNKPSFKDLLGIQSEIQGELRHLLECWLPLDKKGNPLKRIVLFVDDIDRCSEERIVQLIDALRVMLEDDGISKRVIVIAAIDERMLKRAIKWKYRELLGADKKLDKIGEWEMTTMQITSEYMDKLFLSGIRLGTLTSLERVEVYKQFSRGKISDKRSAESSQSEEDTSSLEINSSSAVVERVVSQVNTFTQATRVIRTLADSKEAIKPPKTPKKIKSEADSIEQSVETKFELSSEEDKFLERLITDMADATPRQIRIFYYRYMLARNLLTAALFEMDNDDKYATDERNQLTAQLLIHYTSLRSNSELMEDRKALIMKEQPDKITISKLIEGKDNGLVNEVMEVLEMVIAY